MLQRIFFFNSVPSKVYKYSLMVELFKIVKQNVQHIIDFNRKNRRRTGANWKVIEPMPFNLLRWLWKKMAKRHQEKRWGQTQT